MFEVKEKPRLVERAFLLSVIRREEEREEANSLLEELSELVKASMAGDIGCVEALGAPKSPDLGSRQQIQ